MHSRISQYNDDTAVEVDWPAERTENEKKIKELLGIAYELVPLTGENESETQLQNDVLVLGTLENLILLQAVKHWQPSYLYKVTFLQWVKVKVLVKLELIINSGKRID